MQISFKKHIILNLFRNQKSSLGFTLVELLVVISIIVLLATMASVVARQSRAKGKYAGMQATLSQVRFEALLIYDREASFVSLCDASNTLNETTNDNLFTLEAEIRRHSGGSDPICYASSNGYCVQSSLDTGESHCIDLSGYAGATANCDDTNYDCQ